MPMLPSRIRRGRWLAVAFLAVAVVGAVVWMVLTVGNPFPPRTLVMMFGDHGFLLDPVVGGTSAGRSGGASPEEVLVPAFAWLVGNVH